MSTSKSRGSLRKLLTRPLYSHKINHGEPGTHYYSTQISDSQIQNNHSV